MNMNNTRKSIFLFLLILSFTLTGCLSQQTTLKEQLKLAGSTTVEPAARAAAERFMIRYPNVEVSVRGGGSTIGVKGVAYGALHIGMTSRPFTIAELDQWPNLTATVIGRDGVSVVVNKDVYEAGVTQLTLEQVAAIWRGEITNWNEVGGPDLPIVAFDKEIHRGTRDVFARAVLGDEEALAPGTVGALGENEAVITAVSQTSGAVSIVSSGWQTSDVVGLAIVNRSGIAIEPTAENIASGRYPILRDLNLITNGPPQGLAAQFIEFMRSPDGQTFVREAGYVPVSD